MKKAIKKKKIIYISVAIVAVVILFFPIGESFLGTRVSNVEKITGDFLDSIIPEKIANPAPLKFFGGSFDSKLSRDGVLLYTNNERVAGGILPLKINTKLNSAAEKKLDEMFAEQFFAHISPEGIGAPELAKSAGYDYIAIGENLALGNFANDSALVAAWMASPGHRANILTKRFEDIGIAVRKGTFEGKTAWLAVQTFGVPASSCISIDTSLKRKIEDNKARLTVLEQDLEAKKNALDVSEPKSGKEYNAKVTGYNAVVNEYNTLVKNTQTLIASYNAEVREYNKCAEGV
ncbi:MAG: CAP domain-containing protein [Candidatus Taylorbacteria bacterium]